MWLIFSVIKVGDVITGIVDALDIFQAFSSIVTCGSQAHTEMTACD